MKALGMALIAVPLLAGCNVSVNNVAVENQLDAAANDFGNVADAAGQAADNAANTIENQADAVKNGVDVDIHLRGRAGGENANKQ